MDHSRSATDDATAAGLGVGQAGGRVLRLHHRTGLVGRDVELAAIDRAAGALAAGSGRLVVIEGAPGTGKTALMEEAADRFAARGIASFAARAAELEIDYPFGVVRQLFGRLGREEGSSALFDGAAGLAVPLVSDAPAPDAFAGEADVSFARLHGLYWLCVNCSERGPMALFLDDAQWCDVGSLRFLDFLGRRVRELPIGIVVAARDGLNRGAEGEMERLLEHTDVEVLRLGALAKAETDVLIARTLGEQPEPKFSDACYAATRGSPLLMRELLKEIVASAVTPDVTGARTVMALNPAAISQLVHRRLRGLPAPARVIAEAVAVVGDDLPVAEITRFARLANFEDDAAVSAAIDALVEGQILEFEEQRIRYSHPIVRSSVYHGLSPTARAQGHRRAAELLRGSGDPERLAAHVLACPPLGAEWVVSALRAAARRAVSLGALESARRYIARALEEAPSADRLELLLELGAIEQVLDRPAAERTLREALAVADTPEAYFRAAAALGTALVYSSNAAEAHEALLAALRAAPAGDADGRMRVEAQIRMNAHLGGYLSASDLARIDGLTGLEEARTSEGPGATLLLACMALTHAVSGHFTADESRALARTVVSRHRVADRRLAGGGPYYAALRALMYADALREAHGILSTMIADAERRGLLYDFAVASWSQAEVCLRRGELQDAEANATVAVAAMQQGNWSPWVPGAVATLAQTQLERGAIEDAWTTLTTIDDWEQYPERATGLLRYARGLYWLAQGNGGAALEDLLAAAHASTEWDRDFPPRLPWRSNAALAAHAAGDADAARAFAAEELALARRFGAPRALGIALRVSGMVAAPGAGPAQLEESVLVLADSEAHLEHARSLVALGERVVATDGARARELLAKALDLADAAGARRLAAEAKALLVRAGGRPKRTALRGLDALTASERRIAEMAADGLTNKQIAQAIFVTTKTVELHLGNAYKKLGIASRQQLPDVLLPAASP